MKSSQVNSLYLTAFGKNWGWFLLWGIALVILGIIAIGATMMTTLVTVLFIGFLLLIGGIVIIIDTFSFWWHNWSGFFLHLLIGIIYIAVAVMLINNPLIASVTLTLFLGIFYLIAGIFRIIYSMSIRSPRWGWSLFNAIISLLLGILILSSWPISGLYIIGLFVGIDLLFTGWAYIMASMAARSMVSGVK